MGYYDHGPIVQLDRAVTVIGFQGSEAPAIAQLMASLSGLPFQDVDRLVEHEVGSSRAAYARSAGLDALREKESRALDRALRDRPLGVIALGDAALLRPTDAARILDETDLIYVERPFEVLLTRLRERSAKLADTMPEHAPNPDFHLERLHGLFIEREPGYLQARHRVSAEDAHVNEVARRLVGDLGWSIDDP